MTSRERCRATSRRSGERCRRWPAPGQAVCASHGAKSPQARAKAAERLAVEAARADAEQLLGHRATAGVDDPLRVLAEVTAEAVALKDALAARVNALKSMRYSAPGAGTEQIRAEMLLYERSLDRVAKLSDTLARHNWEGRRMQLAEDSGRLLAGVVRAILERLELDERQRSLVPLVVPEEMRRVAQLEAGATVRGELE